MGISRLLHHLEPYATPVVLEKDKHEDAREAGIASTKIIIDGPGLAYYAYHQTLSRRSQARNALEAMPTYKEVNVFVFKLLGQLEICGLDILQTYLNQLLTFRSQHPDGPHCAPKDVFMYDDIFASRPIPAKLRNLPAAPFLVPSVIESLQASQYAGVTCVVPGEADAYCADLAKSEGGGIVLSGDSDLLLHDLGADGCVMLFRDIDLGDRGKLKTYVYQPANIASAVGLESLLPLAFVLREDSYRTMLECVRLAKGVGRRTVGYGEFCREYGETLGSMTINPRAPATHPDRTSPPQEILNQYLRVLDPRISEYVYQVGAPGLPSTLSSHASSSQAPSATTLTMYLPFLIDDPSRASSWRPSTPLRQLAYSTLHLLSPTPPSQDHELATCTEEFQRRGPRIAGTTVEHLAMADLIVGLKDLSAAIRECRGLVNAESVPFFPILALHILLHTFSSTGSPVPSTAQVFNVLRGRVGVLDWAHLHLCAQWQGVLYSLRMVRQFLGVGLVMGGPPEVVREFVEGLEGVQGGLEEMGTLEGLLDRGVEGEGEERLRTVVERLVGKFGGDGEGGSGKQRKRKKQKRMREGDGEGTGSLSSACKGKGNNMFSLLLDQS